MTSVQTPNLAEGRSVIRVAIVCAPETATLADSLETLLADAKGFTFSRFEYRDQSGLKPKPTGLGNPDVVVATLDSMRQQNLFRPLIAAGQKGTVCFHPFRC